MLQFPFGLRFWSIRGRIIQQIETYSFLDSILEHMVMAFNVEYIQKMTDPTITNIETEKRDDKTV